MTPDNVASWWFPLVYCSIAWGLLVGLAILIDRLMRKDD